MELFSRKVLIVLRQRNSKITCFSTTLSWPALQTYSASHFFKIRQNAEEVATGFEATWTEELIEVIFARVEAKAINVASDFKEMKSLLVGMSGGETADRFGELSSLNRD